MTHSGIVVYPTLEAARRYGFDRIEEDGRRHPDYWVVSCALRGPIAGTQQRARAIVSPAPSAKG